MLFIPQILGQHLHKKRQGAENLTLHIAVDSVVASHRPGPDDEEEKRIFLLLSPLVCF